ncbi:hypothetical protein SPAR91_1801 [Streptococcus pneumoniae GA47283]|nr:hypothetical protein SPAR91_1801 [Streptococcus pneumoniae GA47283]
MHVVQNLVNIPKLTRIFISKQKQYTIKVVWIFHEIYRK